MTETDASDGHSKQRVFLSYSRADRQRVLGLVALLESLNHEVFFDQRSIRAGKRWKRKLEEELRGSNICVVFWTRHAAKSKWVRWEYENFAAQGADRTLVPMLGDATPLNDTLSPYQHADFCPLINELLQTVRDLEDKGVNKKEIQKVVSRRLEEEEIELSPDKKNRVFGTFGIVGLSTLPLHSLQVGRDLMIEKATSLPAAYYATAGAAATAGVLSCQGISTMLDNRTDRELVPDIYSVPVKFGQTGTGACDAQNMICVSLSRARIFDKDRKFFGYSTPTCNAKIVKKRSCKASFDTDFALSGVVVRRSPDADGGVSDLSRYSHFCLFAEKIGKKGIYESANCVKP